MLTLQELIERHESGRSGSGQKFPKSMKAEDIAQIKRIQLEQLQKKYQAKINSIKNLELWVENWYKNRIEMIKLRKEGLTYKEIAQRVGKSEQTVFAFFIKKRKV